MSNFKIFLVKRGLVPLEFFNKHKEKFSGGAAMWRTISFGAASVVGICMIKVFISKTDEPSEKPEFVKYEHLRRRSKQFPWGDGNKSLFHNPKVNALPDGYES